MAATHQIHMRVTEEQKKQIEALAAARRMSITRYLLSLALAEPAEHLPEPAPTKVRTSERVRKVVEKVQKPTPVEDEIEYPPTPPGEGQTRFRRLYREQLLRKAALGR